MKLLLVLIEGQLYLAGILAIFVAELALLFWGLWSRRPIVGLVAVFVAVPLMRSTLNALRACFVRIDPPEGLSLARSDAGALYGLIEDIGRTIGAPPVESIAITGDFNASAVTHRPPWRLRRSRTLVLGLPVLTTLSMAELRAVIAHELAHFSSAHDPYAAWVYRTRSSWFALRAALDRRLATPVYVYWLIGWYVPRLNMASAEVARRHELAADRVAAEVAGARAAADALIVFESGERFADETHWPKIQISHETAPEPPRPYAQMLRWGARTALTDILEDLFAGDTDVGDTHPSLRERFACLEQEARLPPPIGRSAGEELFGAGLEALAATLDEGWLTRNGESWHERRAQYLDRRTALDRLSAIASPTPDELFNRATLIEILDGADQALPIYRSAAEQEHAAASLAAGRLLLDRMDATGITLLEAAMDRDDSLVPDACRILAEYYRQTNQELAARKCEWRATRQTTQARLAQRA